MSLRDELEIPGEVSAADVQRAYDEAGRYQFMGRRLEPWTVRRQSVALQLGCRLLRGMNDENDSVSQFLAGGFYPRVYHDVLVVLYLMHLDKKEVVQLEQLPEAQAMDQIYDWAEAIPLKYGSGTFFEGAKIMGKILHSMHISWFQTAKKELGDNGEKKILPADIERPGNLSSLPAQSGPAVSMPITS
jgi:hypothetical protein